MIQWGHDLVARAKQRRDWKALPSQFEADAVRFAYQKIKDHFCPRREIRQRIKASKARTFEELESALGATPVTAADKRAELRNEIASHGDC